MADSNTYTNRIILEDGASKTLLAIIKNVDKLKASFGDFGDGLAEATKQAEKLVQQLENASKQSKQLKDNLGKGTESWVTKLNQAASLLGKVWNTVKSIGGSFVNIADSFIETNSALRSIVSSEEELSSLQAKIWRSAKRARTEFTETASIVARLVKSTDGLFNNLDQAVLFTETLQKSFRLSGASAAEATSATRTLTQALASGELRATQLNSILRSSPAIVKSIADYMGVTVQEVRNLATQGKITSDVLKNSILSQAKEINDEFQQLPKTWRDSMTEIKNAALEGLQPVIELWERFINSEAFETFKNIVIQGITTIGTIAVNVITWIVENLELMKVIIATILALVALFGSGFKRVIAIIVLLAMAFLQWEEIAATAIGNIVGSIYWLGAAFRNVGLWIVRQVAYIADWCTNAWNDIKYAFELMGWGIQVAFHTVVGAVISGVQSMVQWVADKIEALINGILKGINAVIRLLNKIPGVNIGEVGEVDFQIKTNWNQSQIDTLADLYNNKPERPERSTKWIDAAGDYESTTDAFNKGWGIGYNWTRNIGDSLRGLIGIGQGLLDDGEDFIDLLEAAGIGDGTGGSGSGGSGGAGKNVGNVKNVENVEQLKDVLKYLRIMNENTTITRAQTITPDITVNVGAVNNATVEDIADAVSDAITNSMAISYI